MDPALYILILLNNYVISLMSLTSSALAMVPSANKCYLISAKSGTVGFATFNNYYNNIKIPGSGYIMFGYNGLCGGGFTVFTALSAKGSFNVSILNQI